MIDFIKIVIYNYDLIQRVWNNQNLIYQSEEKRLFNDEIKEIRRKTFKGLTFTLFDKRLEITGSLHKFFNNGVHNATDFSFLSCIHVVMKLETILELNLEQCFIVNLEYGLNLIPGKSVKNVVTWLKFHERNEFRNFPELEYAKQSGSFKDGKINTYKTIKAYAKGLEPFGGKCYGDTNTFRFEVKSKQSKYIRELGIENLSDLLNLGVYETLSDKIIKEWNNVLILESSLLKNDKKLNKYSSIDFWEESLQEYRNKFSNDKNRFFKLLENYPENIHSEISNLIKTKLESFKNELKNGANSTPHLYSDKNKNGAISNYVKMESAPQKNIYCIVTGLQIHNQRPGTKYLSEKSIHWYFENEPETYKNELEILIKQKLLNKYKNEPQKLLFGKIYKQIRNKDRNPKNNPRNNTKNSYRKIESKGFKIWPTMDYINPAKKKYLQPELID
jgi:hypothetical protein